MQTSNTFEFWQELFKDNPCRNTERKKANTLNTEIKQLNYIINHIEPQIDKNGFAWHLGIKMYRKELTQYKLELSFIQDNFNKLINL